MNRYTQRDPGPSFACMMGWVTVFVVLGIMGMTLVTSRGRMAQMESEERELEVQIIDVKREIQHLNTRVARLTCPTRLQYAIENFDGLRDSLISVSVEEAELLEVPEVTGFAESR